MADKVADDNQDGVIDEKDASVISYIDKMYNMEFVLKPFYKIVDTSREEGSQEIIAIGAPSDARSMVH
ncbi:MAG: hypothetical protein IIX54_05935, partial [Clostridia bacterium]|nr:hypothetical protein [Clostridia bacterium]